MFYVTLTLQTFISLDHFVFFLSNGHGSSRLPYVGFRGLSLTPIQESPLVDSMLSEDPDSLEGEKWLSGDVMVDTWNPAAMKKGSLPKHWGQNGREPSSPPPADSGDAEAGMQSGVTPKACSVNVHLVQTTTFLPKEEPMSSGQKRAHICKLLLFALCGFVIVAGIVLWIFSPAFT